jgi:hypothetical protein
MCSSSAATAANTEENEMSISDTLFEVGEEMRSAKEWYFEAHPRVAGKGRLVEAFEKADELRARVTDGNDLNRPPRLRRHRVDGIHVALREVDGGHTDDGSTRSRPVDPCAAEPDFSELPFGCTQDQMSRVLVLGIDR